MNHCSFIASVLFIVVLTISSCTNTSAASDDEFVPSKDSEFLVMDMSRAQGEAIRRSLAGAYKQCSTCKCCRGTTCANQPCCYSIDCQVPGKPAGSCSFVPKACNCTNCS